MPSYSNGPILPVNKPKKKKSSSGGFGTVILLILIVILAVAIIRSAVKKDVTYTPGTVRDINSWAQVSSNTATPEPQLRPTAEANGLLPIYYNANTQKRMVALTVQGITNYNDLDRLLGVLGTYNAKATFFLNGSDLVNYSSMWPAAVLGGHEIESCGLSETGLAAMNATELASNIDGFTANLRQLIGVEYNPHFFRPAEMSDYDNARLHNALSKRGYYGIASWSVASPSGMEQIAPGQVIAINLASYGVQRLTDMLAALEANGYSVVTLNRLFDYPENIISSEAG